MRTPKLTIYLVFRPVSTFLLGGVLGLLAGTLLGMALAWHTGYSTGLAFGLGLLSTTVFLGMALGTKLLTGQENLVYYRQEVAIVLVAALFLNLIGQPVLPYLDLVLLGVGVFLAIGRIGCYHAGCCHGRPWRHGVCYGAEHRAAGFTPHLSGLPIFPIQLLESLMVLGVVFAGASIFLSDAPKGSVLGWYTLAYGTGRFVLEFWRGDPARPYWLGLSEAQWTTLALVALTLLFERLAVLPHYSWHWSLGTALGLAALGYVLLWHFSPAARVWQLLRPAHLAEIYRHGSMGFDGRISTKNTDIRLWESSEGLLVSFSTPAAGAAHFALSDKKRLLTPRRAKLIGGQLAWLFFHKQAIQVIPGQHGVFHVVIPNVATGLPSTLKYDPI